MFHLACFWIFGLKEWAKHYWALQILFLHHWIFFSKPSLFFFWDTYSIFELNLLNFVNKLSPPQVRSLCGHSVVLQRQKNSETRKIVNNKIFVFLVCDVCMLSAYLCICVVHICALHVPCFVSLAKATLKTSGLANKLQWRHGLCGPYFNFIWLDLFICCNQGVQHYTHTHSAQVLEQRTMADRGHVHMTMCVSVIGCHASLAYLALLVSVDKYFFWPMCFVGCIRAIHT